MFADSVAELLGELVRYGHKLGAPLPPDQTYERLWHDRSISESDHPG
jgi:hypothetical protein